MDLLSKRLTRHLHGPDTAAEVFAFGNGDNYQLGASLVTRCDSWQVNTWRVVCQS